jgi:hypothetical protein
MYCGLWSHNVPLVIGVLGVTDLLEEQVLVRLLQLSLPLLLHARLLADHLHVRSLGSLFVSMLLVK